MLPSLLRRRQLATSSPSVPGEAIAFCITDLSDYGGWRRSERSASGAASQRARVAMAVRVTTTQGDNDGDQ
jgi:hypothetical protein